MLVTDAGAADEDEADAEAGAAAAAANLRLPVAAAAAAAPGLIVEHAGTELEEAPAIAACAAEHAAGTTWPRV